jgi:hypothetical protein
MEKKDTRISGTFTANQRSWLEGKARINSSSLAQALRGVVADAMARQEQAEEAVGNGHRNGTWSNGPLPSDYEDEGRV